MRVEAGDESEIQEGRGPGRIPTPSPPSNAGMILATVVTGALIVAGLAFQAVFP